MNYYNPIENREASQEELQFLGIPIADEVVLKKLSWYKLFYKNDFAYDKMLFKLIKLGIPVYDKTTDCYTQNYELKPLTNDEQQMMLGAYKDIIIRKIDNKTSEAIVAGFDADINYNGTIETFHFSYDELDQGNFVDMSTRIMMSALTGTTISEDGFISWNGYRNHTETYKGDLVVLKLTIDQMQALYFRALVHKSVTMSNGKTIKILVTNAVSIPELKYLINEYKLEVDDVV